MLEFPKTALPSVKFWDYFYGFLEAFLRDAKSRVLFPPVGGGHSWLVAVTFGDPRNGRSQDLRPTIAYTSGMWSGEIRCDAKGEGLM